MSEGNYWAVLTAPILECARISDGAKLFYAQISRYTNSRGYCWASNRALSEELGIGERTVSRYVAELEEAGFIQTELVGVSDRKRRRERHIRLAVPHPFDLAKNGDFNLAKNGEANLAKNGETLYVDKYKQDNTPHTPQGGGADYFERFWALYPKKRNKQAAIRAWKRLAPDEALCYTMSRALKLQMQSDEWQREDGRFIPYPASWINGRRWEDDDLVRAPEPRGGEEAFGVWH